MKYNTLIASIVYIITDLLKKKKMDVKTFRAHVWPALKTVTQAKETTAQAIYLFVAHYEVLEEYIGEPDVTTYVMPLYLKCFDCPAKLKQLALSMVPKMSKKSDYQFLKTKILPKMLGLLKDPNIDIRKDTLKALFGILNSIDTQTISLTILPGL
jgi:L-rhamnose mutarotase